jgi:hypothetical protein
MKPHIKKLRTCTYSKEIAASSFFGQREQHTNKLVCDHPEMKINWTEKACGPCQVYLNRNVTDQQATAAALPLAGAEPIPAPTAPAPVPVPALPEPETHGHESVPLAAGVKKRTKPKTAAEPAEETKRPAAAPATKRSEPKTKAKESREKPKSSAKTTSGKAKKK